MKIELRNHNLVKDEDIGDVEIPLVELQRLLGFGNFAATVQPALTTELAALDRLVGQAWSGGKFIHPLGEDYEVDAKFESVIDMPMNSNDRLKIVQATVGLTKNRRSQ